MSRLSLRLLVLLVLVVVTSFLYFRVADTDPVQMMAKYGGASARLVDDGVGGKIHYRDSGPHDAPALLLVHGSNSSLHTWEDMAVLLSKHYRVISFDQHGHGLTGPHANNDYSARAKIDAAIRVLNAAGVSDAVWIGNSMGGWLSWRAALAVPERVLGVVLIDASGVQGGEKQKLYLAARLMKTWLGQLLLPHITPRVMVHKSLEANFVDNTKVTDVMINRYWELIRYPGNRRATAFRANTDREPEMWKHIGRIQAPGLILWGEQDKVIPLSYANAFDRALPNSRLITYPQAGHLPNEELPEQLVADINDWLNEHNIQQAN